MPRFISALWGLAPDFDLAYLVVSLSRELKSPRPLGHSHRHSLLWFRLFPSLKTALGRAQIPRQNQPGRLWRRSSAYLLSTRRRLMTNRPINQPTIDRSISESTSGYPPIYHFLYKRPGRWSTAVEAGVRLFLYFWLRVKFAKGWDIIHRRKDLSESASLPLPQIETSVVHAHSTSKSRKRRIPGWHCRWHLAECLETT